MTKGKVWKSFLKYALPASFVLGFAAACCALGFTLHSSKLEADRKDHKAYNGQTDRIETLTEEENQQKIDEIKQNDNIAEAFVYTAVGAAGSAAVFMVADRMVSKNEDENQQEQSLSK